MQKEELKPLVLNADDEPRIRATLVQILKQQGYETVAVNDGNVAVDCVKELLPDIFLGDVSMPCLNWIEAAKVAKSISLVSRILCFSGYASASDLLAPAQEQGSDFEFISQARRDFGASGVIYSWRHVFLRNITASDDCIANLAFGFHPDQFFNSHKVVSLWH